MYGSKVIGAIHTRIRGVLAFRLALFLILYLPLFSLCQECLLDSSRFARDFHVMSLASLVSYLSKRRCDGSSLEDNMNINSRLHLRLHLRLASQLPGP